MIVSCGGGVDNSDPKAVAEAALVGWQSGTSKGMSQVRDLVNPEDTETLQELDKVIEGIKAMEANGTNKQATTHSFTFVKIKDAHGDEMSEETTTAKVEFKNEEGSSYRVRVKKENGVWYFDKFN